MHMQTTMRTRSPLSETPSVGHLGEYQKGNQFEDLSPCRIEMIFLTVPSWRIPDLHVTRLALLSIMNVCLGSWTNEELVSPRDQG
jgi:hypothetical protein